MKTLRVSKWPMAPYRCAPFYLNDQVLIEGAAMHGRPEHVATALAVAICGFRHRMQMHPPLPVNDAGELVLRICKPKNYFDRFVVVWIVQEICDDTGMGLALEQWEGPPNQKQPASPDVEFIQEANPPNRLIAGGGGNR